MTPFGAEVQAFADIARELAQQGDVEGTLHAIAARAVAMVPGAEIAAITIRRSKDRYTTVTPTDPLAEQVDAIQYEHHEGPCVDSLESGFVFCSDDIGADPRWPRFGPEAARATGVTSMLSQRLFLEYDEQALGALNLYSKQPAAFAEHDPRVAGALATHSAIALAKANAEEQNESLHAGLDSNRRIGMAIGILIATYKTTPEQGFDLLRMASQHSHRKLRDVAEDLIETGELSLQHR